MDWTRYFEMMIDWKKLPAYRTEPRMDSFIGFYLTDFAADYFGDQILGIIPEFPIRLGTVNKKHENTNYADRSYKVDFYLHGESGINYFVEFKTDSKSRRDKQDHYLINAKNVGMNMIVKGIQKIASVSSYKKKYIHLLTKLLELNILDENGNFVGSDGISIVYIQPNNNNNRNDMCIDFQWIYNWFKQKKKLDEFEKNFAQTLKIWSSD